MKKGGGMREPEGQEPLKPPAKPAAPIKLKGIVIDEDKAKYAGNWKSGNMNPVTGKAYRTDDNKDKGKKSVTFQLTVPKPGEYRIVLLYTPFTNRASNTPVTVTIGDKSKTVKINQKTAKDGGAVIGTFKIEKKAELVVSNKDTNGYVIVDGVQLLAAGE